MKQKMNPYDLHKRALDLVGSTVLILLSAPLAAILITLCIIFQGLPVFFLQVRPGLNGKNFTIVKFRTMVCTREGKQQITAFGSLLRRLSLDELPQLLNILRGEMSFVGPRPLLTEYLQRYSPQQARRHEVRPGLTGLAQVNGRNLLSWEDRLALDVMYVEQYSFALDFSILWKTFRAVLVGKGVEPANSRIMSRFTGDKHASPGTE